MSFEINERGYWVGENKHHTDKGLKSALCEFVSEQSSLVDFGCGDASYAKEIAQNGLDVEAYDGNPVVVSQTNGFAKVLDLSEPFDLERKFDVVMSLEVAEHLPKKYEEVYVDNLIKHTNGWLIISWAVPGQGGKGHFNEQPEEYVLKLFENKGFSHKDEYSKYLRNSITNLSWFKNTIFVFNKDGVTNG
tara:strand:+ start:117 stop:686 length:570 start_codon:yes stop_codon:yes gene_type:complete